MRATAVKHKSFFNAPQIWNSRRLPDGGLILKSDSFFLSLHPSYQIDFRENQGIDLWEISVRKPFEQGVFISISAIDFPEGVSYKMIVDFNGDGSKLSIHLAELDARKIRESLCALI